MQPEQPKVEGRVVEGHMEHDVTVTHDANMHRVNGIFRLNRTWLVVFAILAISTLISAIALVFLAHSNRIMESRLACRGEATEHIQAAIGRGFVAAIHEQQDTVEQAGEDIQHGVEELEECNGEG